MVKGDACSFYINIFVFNQIAWVRGILRDFIPPRLFYVPGGIIHIKHFLHLTVQNQMSEEIIKYNALAPFVRTKHLHKRRWSIHFPLSLLMVSYNVTTAIFYTNE
jgi:hypothetical protein